MLTRPKFIAPMLATPAAAPPSGGEWLHEVKFDGYRVQIHIGRGAVTLYSRNGHDMTRRFRAALRPLRDLAVREAVIDAELVACGADGQPDFEALWLSRQDAPAACACGVSTCWRWPASRWSPSR